MYERIQGNDMYNAGPNIPFSLNVTNNSVTLQNPNVLLATGGAAARPINPASIAGLAINQYKQPASYQYSIGVQRQLNAKSVLSISYVGNQNRYQNNYREINLPSESYLPALIGGAQNNNAPGLPYPGYHSINFSTNEANSHYNSLQVDLTSHVRDLTLRAYYTLSRTIDPTTSGNGGGDLGNVSNPYLGWKYDNGPSGYDRTHNAAVNFIYDIPFLRNSTNRLLKSTIGGWEVSGIITMTSGLPINPQLTGGQSGNGLPNATNRPDQVGSVSYPHTVSQWFNTAAFANPAVGGWGNAGHKSLCAVPAATIGIFRCSRASSSMRLGIAIRVARGKLQHLESHRVRSSQQCSGLEQFRPGDFCVRSKSISVRSETLLLIECLMCSRPARAR